MKLSFSIDFSPAGVRAIAAQEEPIRRVLSRMEVADGLTLEKVMLDCK